MSQSDCSGKTLKLWPVFVDHFTLIKRIVELATERNISELWLYTPDKQALYRNLGWKEREQRLVAGESVTVMVLSLPCPDAA
nr:hypothetical protein [Pantoea ananatis]